MTAPRDWGCMLLTTAIVTWNRAPLLEQTLAGLERLVRPEQVDWEVVVVCNACTDRTPEVLESFRGRLPLVVAEEPVLGVSRARNRAVHVGRGDYYVWTDDDVLVGPGWLACYLEAFRRHPEVALFGGPIEAWFEGAPPAWLLEGITVVRSAYAVCDLGQDEGPLAATTGLPFGANYAVRGDVQRKVAYDVSVGYRGARRVSGEETTLMRVILRDYPGLWVPSARVRHHVGRERQTLSYLSRYYFGQGQLIAGHLRRRWSNDFPLIASYSTRCLYAWLRFAWWRVVGGPGQWLDRFRTACRCAGIVAGTWSGVWDQDDRALGPGSG